MIVCRRRKLVRAHRHNLFVLLTSCTHFVSIVHSAKPVASLSYSFCGIPLASHLSQPSPIDDASILDDILLSESTWAASHPDVPNPHPHLAEERSDHCKFMERTLLDAMV